MAVALIVAAGSGERLQAGMPKALVELHGKSLLAWSVEALLAAPSVQEIVVALPEGVQAPAGAIGVRGGAVRSE
jgi:2-C-methyl-D-erythritol 4-phosphate cytidylyltransferase